MSRPRLRTLPPTPAPQRVPAAQGGPTVRTSSAVQDATPFSSARGGFRSGEAAALEVTTSEGDTVSVSYQAFSRVRTFSESGQANGASGRHGESFRTSVNISVSVDGSLSQDESQKIGDLLDRLVSSARSETPAQGTATGLSGIASIQFGYRAYQSNAASEAARQAEHAPPAEHAPTPESA